MPDVSVVIPSIKADVRTLESVPAGVETQVVRKGTLNEARNIGVRAAAHDRVVILDDDVAFDERFFWDLADRIEPGTLVGHPDWDYGLVAGRVMAFHRDDWDRLGGFDEFLRSHMGDTEFALKFVSDGCGVERIDSDGVDHEPHERSVTTWDRAWRTAYLAAKYPRWAPRLLRNTVT
jgi:glycosyltransferase involved in cell wall biosynthesis